MRWAGSCLLGFAWLRGGGEGYGTRKRGGEGLAATNVFDRNPGERLPHTEEQNSPPHDHPIRKEMEGGVSNRLCYGSISQRFKFHPRLHPCCNPALSSSLKSKQLTPLLVANPYSHVPPGCRILSVVAFGFPGAMSRKFEIEGPTSDERIQI